MTVHSQPFLSQPVTRGISPVARQAHLLRRQVRLGIPAGRPRFPERASEGVPRSGNLHRTSPTGLTFAHTIRTCAAAISGFLFGKSGLQGRFEYRVGQSYVALKSPLIARRSRSKALDDLDEENVPRVVTSFRVPAQQTQNLGRHPWRTAPSRHPPHQAPCPTVCASPPSQMS